MNKKLVQRKLIKSDMRKLMKCMDFTIKMADAPHTNPIYYSIYNLLGGLAWSYLCSLCEHEYKVSKKYPTGRCIVCGQIRRPNENKSRIRK